MTEAFLAGFKIGITILGGVVAFYGIILLCVALCWIVYKLYRRSI